jgi:hypothetical protein
LLGLARSSARQGERKFDFCRENFLGIRSMQANKHTNKQTNIHTRTLHKQTNKQLRYPPHRRAPANDGIAAKQVPAALLQAIAALKRQLLEILSDAVRPPPPPRR